MEALRRILTQRGPLPSSGLRQALGMSASSFKRLTAQARDTLLVTGKARATTYAWRREIEGVITPVSLFEVDRLGDTRLVARLHPIEPQGYWVEGAIEGVDDGFHHSDARDPAPLDLPWFLWEVGPAGFLGKAWLRAHPDGGYPAKLERWRGDDIVRYATEYGLDLPGAYILGHVCRDLFEARTAARTVVPDAARAKVFVERAESAMTQHPVGSSLGGDQPKFTCNIGRDTRQTPVIVKFSPPFDTPGGRRWADLLAAEQTAHEVLRGFGHETPISRLLDAGGRRFLEIERFDRHGPRGRSGLVSLLPFDTDDAGSDLESWSIVARHLASRGEVEEVDVATVAWLEAFGHLIANSDMHLGNLSLRLSGTEIRGLAPVYDMLPMWYRPRFGGEVRDEPYDPAQAPVPLTDSTRHAARVYWQQVAARADVSDGFRAICSRQESLAQGSR